MKKIIKTALLITLLPPSSFLQLYSQEQARIVDSTYLNVDIIKEITTSPFGTRGGITIEQSSNISNALNSYISNASQRSIQGFRVRIFFDNSQAARVQSEELVTLFQESYPYIGVYWTYENPYFKVTVGDFRTRSEAMRALKILKESYPAAFIVRENINFPPL